VRLVVAVLILQSYFDLTDEETQERVDFDLCWHLALGLDPCAEGDYVSQRTWQYFRAHLLTHDLIQQFFADTTDQIIAAFGIRTDKQRIDSTHILSNFAQLSRLGLFCETLRVFLRELRHAHPDQYGQLPQSLRDRYHTADGESSHYDDARRSDTRRRLGVCARDAYRLFKKFHDGMSPSMASSYHLLSRLIDEQCDLVDTPQIAESGDGDVDLPAVPITVKAAQAIESSVMQTPHDEDVTYSGHKGQGYDALIVETYHEENPFQVITHGRLEPACESDATRVLSTVEALEERGLLPEELLADTSFGSSSNYVACALKGIELIAPTPGKASAQSTEGSTLLEDCNFDIDLLGGSPTVCPQGITALATSVQQAHDPPIAIITMDSAVCAQCPLARQCARVSRDDGTDITIIDLHAYSMAERRAFEETDEFQDLYRPRGGIEGTNSELKRGQGLGDLRVRRAARVELAMFFRLLSCTMKRAIHYCQRQTKKQTANLSVSAENISGSNTKTSFSY